MGKHKREASSKRRQDDSETNSASESESDSRESSRERSRSRSRDRRHSVSSKKVSSSSEEVAEYLAKKAQKKENHAKVTSEGQNLPTFAPKDVPMSESKRGTETIDSSRHSVSDDNKVPTKEVFSSKRSISANERKKSKQEAYLNKDGNEDDRYGETEDGKPQRKKMKLQAQPTQASTISYSFGEGSSVEDSSEEELTRSTKESSSEECSSREDTSEEEEEQPSRTPEDADVEMVAFTKSEIIDTDSIDSRYEKKTAKSPGTPENAQSKTLFVGNLSFSIYRTDVEDLFKDVGEIVDIRFAMDNDIFKGYGYVEFATAEAAQKAIKLDGTDILRRRVKLRFLRERGSDTPFSSNKRNSYQNGGKAEAEKTVVRGFDKSGGDDEERDVEMVIKQPDYIGSRFGKDAAQSPGILEQTGSKTLHVGNLSYSIERTDVENFFKDVGAMVDVRWAMNHGIFKGYGYIEFATVEAAKEAMKLDGKDLLGRRVKLGFARERGSYTPFSSHERETYQKKGEAQAQTILQDFDKRGDDGKDADVETINLEFTKSELNQADSGPEKNAAQSPGTLEHARSKTLYVGNLSFSIEETDVKNFFTDAGEIVNIRLAVYHGIFKGYGHVEFATEEAAKEAIKLHGKYLLGRRVKLDFARERGSYSPISRESYEKGGKAQMQTIVQGLDKRGADGEDAFTKSETKEAISIDCRSEKKTARSPFTLEHPVSHTLFVGNLSLFVERTDVEDFFKDMGEIIDIRFAKNPNGFRTYAHVEFATVAAAKKAIKLDGQDLLGHHVRLGFARERCSYTPFSSDSDSKQKERKAQAQAVVRSFDKSGSDVEDAFNKSETNDADSNDSISGNNTVQSPFTLEHTVSNTLFVGSLSLSVERTDLEDFFKDVGEIVSIRFAKNPEISRTYAHVIFATVEAAKKAITLNGKELLGRRMKLDFARGRCSYTPFSSEGDSYQKEGKAQAQMVARGFDKRAGDVEDAVIKTEIKEADSRCEKRTAQSPFTLEHVESETLYVGNLSVSAERTDLEVFFKDVGEIVDVRFAKNADISRTYAHIKFATVEAAKKAIKLDGKYLLGLRVKLNFPRQRWCSYTPFSSNERNSYQKEEKERIRTIYVRGFDKSGPAGEIRSAIEDHFGSCGEFVKVSIPRDHDGGLKGFAYIDFRDLDGFNNALELNGSTLAGSTLTVEGAKIRGEYFDRAGSGGRDPGSGFGDRRAGGHDGDRGCRFPFRPSWGTSGWKTRYGEE